MTNKEGLYYAFGEIAYAVAAAGKTIDEAEKKVLHDQLVKSVSDHGLDFDYSEIIFQLLSKDHTDVKTAYEWAMKEMKLHEYYLTEKLKNDFIGILEKIASAKPPVTLDEENLIERFKRDIGPMKGDPVFTG